MWDFIGYIISCKYGMIPIISCVAESYDVTTAFTRSRLEVHRARQFPDR